jgi:hypothetical protein
MVRSHIVPAYALRADKSDRNTAHRFIKGFSFYLPVKGLANAW